jgi:hypothetical protein
LAADEPPAELPLTRLVEPDVVLRRKIVEFVERGDFGLASGTRNGGVYERVWYSEPIGVKEVAFESSVFLLNKAKGQQLKIQLILKELGLGERV